MYEKKTTDFRKFYPEHVTGNVEMVDFHMINFFR